MSAIVITEETTSSSSRIFIKILFQELSQYMGLPKVSFKHLPKSSPNKLLQLNSRLQEDTMQVFFEGLFPKDNPKNTRFAVNFFTSIGLGGLTDDLREFLKTGSLKAGPGSDSDSSDSDSGSDSSSSSSDSSSDDEPENIEALFNKLQKKKAKEEVDVSILGCSA